MILSSYPKAPASLWEPEDGVTRWPSAGSLEGTETLSFLGTNVGTLGWEGLCEKMKTAFIPAPTSPALTFPTDTDPGAMGLPAGPRGLRQASPQTGLRAVPRA